MTDADKLPLPKPNDAGNAPPSYRGRRRWALGFAFIGMLALVAGAGLSFWQMKLMNMQMGGGAGLADTKERLTAVEQQVAALDHRLSELSASTDKSNAVSVASPEGKAPVVSLQAVAASTAAVGRMQNDLAALTATVTGLQAEVKQTGTAVAETQAATQSSLASAIAFMQLRETEATGKGFAAELAALRSAAGKNPGFMQLLAKLDPYAAKGAPTLAALREGFISLEAPASSSIDVADAANWWQRVLAKLKSLVSIRLIHGEGASDAFASMETALTSDDLAAALATYDSLQPAPKDVLKGWHEKAVARQTVDSTIHDLGGHFIAPTSSASAPESSDAPADLPPQPLAAPAAQEQDTP